jgi:elongation factor G
LGSETAGEPGMVVVRAHVPQMELSRYSTELRSFTHGSASFTRRFAHYERVPDAVSSKLVSVSG